jgi:prolyl oligopeptidase
VVSGSIYAPHPVAYRALGADDGWRPLLVGFAASFIGEVDGDALLALTTDRAPRGRIVSIPLATAADRDTWQEVVPEGDGVMRSFTRMGEGLVTAELVDGAWSVRVYNAGGRLDHVVVLPAPVGLDLLFGFGQAPPEPRVFSDGDDAVRLLRTSFALPPAQVRYVPATRALDHLTAAEVAPRALEATLHRCTSSDGTTVTYWAVGLRGVGARRPALVYGYGAFSVVVNTPAYVAAAAPFLDAGGVLILPHLRGGGEHGDAHWREARGHGRQRSYDDLYAVVEDALAAEIVDPARIAFAGASNGGLMAAVALTQRPELWRAVVCAIPLIDVLGMMREPWAAPLVEELGDPRDAADAAVIAQYAPLQAIRLGTRYPAVLVDCGERDLRGPPWHSRKLVAALEAATASGRPILYRERPNGGHVLAEGREWAVWLAFLMRELEMVAR